MVARERVGAPASSVASDGYRYTFSLVPLPEDDPENLRSDLIRLPIGSDVGSEYRLLRNSIGDRFTFSLVRPSPEP